MKSRGFKNNKLNAVISKKTKSFIIVYVKELLNLILYIVYQFKVFFIIIFLEIVPI